MILFPFGNHIITNMIYMKRGDNMFEVKDIKYEGHEIMGFIGGAGLLTLFIQVFVYFI